MASWQRQMIKEKFLNEPKLKKASVLISLGNARWSGTIIGHRSSKTLVLSVAHTFATTPSWMTKEVLENELGAYFYDDPETKCSCKIAISLRESDILLLVVNKCSTADDKLILASGEERDLKELQFLGCFGHPVGYQWEMETGRVCNTELTNSGDQLAMKDYDPNMTYFEHRLDLTVGYSGAGLFNENYNLVGIHTGNPIVQYSVMAAKRLDDQLAAMAARKAEHEARLEAMQEFVDEGAREREMRCLSEKFTNAFCGLGEEDYKTSDAIKIGVPMCQLKFAIHVNYVVKILRQILEEKGVSIGESLVQALEDYFIRP